MSFLSLQNLSMSFDGGAAVLQDVSLEVAEGEFLVIVGPSGCGKSTLLRVVAGLEAPTAGTVSIDGRVVNDLEPVHRDVAMVFQNYALYPHMSVRRNLAFPLKMRRVAPDERERRVAQAAEILGLTALLERKPGTLSGGQMQRVALGRAIVRDPRVFLFDEPLSNLDAKLRLEMRKEIARLHARLGITSLYVTHDQAEAMTLGSRICVLNQGRIEQVGPPLEVFARPATTFVATFIGSPPMNLIEGRVEAGRFRAGSLDLPAPEGASGTITLGIRPHEVALEGDLELVVEEVEALGTQTLVRGSVGEISLAVCREGTLPCRPGNRIPIGLPPTALHAFDTATDRRL
jgi:sn-glycerol 3-phosphate transport system ATP-binding protein